MKAPDVDGVNATRMEIMWEPPPNLNGPDVTYTLRKTRGSFSHPPPSVSKGTRFPGFGYYKFPAYTIPQGVAFSGSKLSKIANTCINISNLIRQKQCNHAPFAGFELWFKTRQLDGLLLFAATEGGQEEFVAIQLRAGRPWFLFDPQGKCCIHMLIICLPSIYF